MNESKRGGYRPNSGRHKTNVIRKVKAFRLTEDEFILMKQFHKLIRTNGIDQCQKILDNFDTTE